MQGYLIAQGKSLTPSAALRDKVEFAYLNLAEDSWPSLSSRVWDMDIVLCRNVLIYLAPDHVRAVAQRFYACLAEGGCLIAGPSDPLLTEFAPFVAERTPAGLIYRRRRNAWEAARMPISVVSSTDSGPAVALLLADDPAPAPAPGLRDPGAASSKPLPSIATSADMRSSPVADVADIRRLADRGDSTVALERCADMLTRRPHDAELHALQVMLLLEASRIDDAADAVRRLVYLHRELPFAHFLLGVIRHRQGRLQSARNAYARVLALASRLPPDAPLALTDGQCAAQLASAARDRIAQMDALCAGLP